MGVLEVEKLNKLISSKSMTHIGLALVCMCLGLFFVLGTHSPLIGYIYIALALSVAVIGLVLPSRIGDSSEVDCSVLMTLFMPLTVSAGWNITLVTSIVGVLLVFSIISVIIQRRKTQQLLNLMWELAGNHGYDAQQVKHLATFKRNRYNYTVSEWELTKSQKPKFYPNMRAVQLVISKLK